MNQLHVKKESAKLWKHLEPYANWDDDGSCNEEARLALLEFGEKLRRHPPDKEYCCNVWHFSYLISLFAVREALEEQKYRRACHEIENILHFESVFQPRIQQNLLKLLDAYLGAE